MNIQKNSDEANCKPYFKAERDKQGVKCKQCANYPIVIKNN